MRRVLRSDTQKNIEVEGLVLPADWDSGGRETMLKISAPGEVSYLLADDLQCRRMRSFLRQYVRVIGYLEVDALGEERLVVERVLRHE